MIPTASGVFNYGSDPSCEPSWRKTWMLVALVASLIIHVALVISARDYRLNKLPLPAEEFRRSLDVQAQPMRVTRAEDPVAVNREEPDRDIPREQQKTELNPTEDASQSSALSPSFAQLPPPPETSLPALKVGDTLLQTDKFISRQKVLDVADRQVKVALPGLERIMLPQAERITHAPDLLPPVVDVSALRNEPKLELAVHTPGLDLFVSPTGNADSSNSIQGREQVPTANSVLKPPAIESNLTEERFSDPIISPTNENPPQYISVDDRLQVRVVRFDDDSQWVYYGVQVLRKSDATLPVLPKDVVIVQDVSASIAEVRLAFCRQGLIAMLPEILREGDRWQLLAFSAGPLAAFKNWQPVNAQTLATGRKFIEGLRSHGSTDLFALLRDILRMRDDLTRPMVVVVVTDGRPTFGLLESTRIIGEFTRLNRGGVAVYAFGTQPSANRYLLDMLTYCNRGSAQVLSGKRWDIPVAMGPLFSALRNPVMHDIRFTFDTASGGEVYPRLTTALYADRSLWLYGRCKKGIKEAVCQIRGKAGAQDYDVVFNLDIAGASVGTKQIKQSWAEQKMFTLIADYASNPSDVTMRKLIDHAGEYQLPIPYRTSIGK